MGICYLFFFFSTPLILEESREDFLFMSLTLVLAYVLHSSVAGDTISTLFSVYKVLSYELDHCSEQER